LAILIALTLCGPGRAFAYTVNLFYYTSAPLGDRNLDPLPVGCLVQLIHAQAALPLAPDPYTGLPSGDDLLWEGTAIGADQTDIAPPGEFSDLYSYQSGDSGTGVYIRFFDSPNMSQVTYYGVSPLHTLSDLFGNDIWDITAGGLSLWTEHTFSPSPLYSSRPVGGDYDGNGIADAAVFRGSSGRWSILGVTTTYWGGTGDCAVSADYSGDGTDEIAVFRPSGGAWAIRGLTRHFFGQNGDTPVPGDYDGDGTAEIAIYRQRGEIWRIRDLTRMEFGLAGGIPVPGDYDGDGAVEAAAFRPNGGIWEVRDLTSWRYGLAGDIPAPHDYDGDGCADRAVFRPSSGMWRAALSQGGAMTAFLGTAGDMPVPADFSAETGAAPAIFRDPAGLWSIRNLTRIYFGSTGDIPVTR
jgi:hypothetical protein